MILIKDLKNSWTEFRLIHETCACTLFHNFLSKPRPPLTKITNSNHSFRANIVHFINNIVYDGTHFASFRFQFSNSNCNCGGACIGEGRSSHPLPINELAAAPVQQSD